MNNDAVIKALDPRTSWRGLLFCAGAFFTALFVVLMPASSATTSGVTLFVFWALHVSGGLLVLQAAQVFVLRLPWIATRAPLIQVACSGLLGAAVFTPFALMLDFAFAVPEDPQEAIYGPGYALADEFLALAPPFILVWVALNAVWLLRLAPPESLRAQPRAPAPRFWERVPADVGRDLVALSAELHYMRVFTSQGDALVLYSFGQAVEDLKGVVDGVRIHRSHWVAKRHVAQIEPRGQGAVCVTSTGLRLPVSRARRAELSLESVSKA